MNKLISILFLCVLCSCNKESHAYEVSYNLSPNLVITGSQQIVRTHTTFVFKSILSTDEESCLLKQDSVEVSKLWPNADNFQIEYLGTDTNFSNPVNFSCQ